MIGSDCSLFTDMNKRGASNSSKSRRRTIRIGRERIDWLSRVLVGVDVWVVRVGVIRERGLEHIWRGSRHPWCTRRRLRVGVHR